MVHFGKVGHVDAEANATMDDFTSARFLVCPTGILACMWAYSNL